MLIRFKNLILQFGFEPKKMVTSIIGIPFFIRDYCRYKKMAKGNENTFAISELYPVLHERFKVAGEAKGHYFFQDLWAARKIFIENPSRHVDIGSSVGSFIGHLLSFRSVELVDIRKLESPVSGLSFIQSDATKLAEFEDGSLPSISTLHAAEHFGLGRYGDSIDPLAHLKFMKSLARVLKVGGHLYFSVPAGHQQLLFNAHRIFSAKQVVEIFSELRLLSFSCVKDDGLYYENCSLSDLDHESYGLGLFEFTKDHL